LLSAWLICAAALAQTDIEERQLTVLRQNVNLRAKPSMSAEVVAQVSAPEKLTVKSIDGEWAEVVPPSYADLWVLSDYVKNDVIQCNTRVNVRAGAGINFNIVGHLTNGEPITVRGTHADWIRIAPPPGASLWIARAMLEIEPAGPVEKAEAAAVETASAASTTETAPVPTQTVETESALAQATAETPAAIPPSASVPPTPSPDPEPTPAPEPIRRPPSQPTYTAPATIKPPADLALHPGKPQGVWRQYEGVLRPRNFIFGAPSRYRLAHDIDGTEYTICHVRGNEAQLRALLNRRMVISGREYWVKRPDTHPVLVPERIVLK
jgi:uncharacterized protein YgiM (DUF1202 family)